MNKGSFSLADEFGPGSAQKRSVRLASQALFSRS